MAQQITVDYSNDTDRATMWASSYDLDGNGLDALSNVDLALAWLRALGVPVRSLRDKDLDSLVEVRYRVRRVFEVREPAQRTALINDLLSDAQLGAPYVSHEDDTWHLRLVPAGETAAARIEAICAVGLAEFVSAYGPERLGVCNVTPCIHVFADRSRNASRTACSRRCAAVRNSRSYRRRQSAS